ncbi:beta-lactamase class D domain-containing protein [Idiomarina loihiensis GSL 199]|jgi:beta-lactamase class D/ATP-dependent protease ClpP protease subunit|uniref:Beta-lactamase n=1 Tax=Idiomarina loihiensis (strain ATCC BAA-735 / DSM 15497 / L2-TR) TaxID=283942 RepID=Q5QWM3_IDILO|nr:Beta-lactamase class D (N-terminal domain) fused to uncharacterized conserved domain [Idiomarina loihiensis L2TR]AGM36681.1 beta-lactamase class D domain-containing protein [Idiomarina loihiensis GSL 199]
MKISLLVLFILSFAVPVCAETQERSDWGSVFEKYEAEGTIVVVDGRDSEQTTLVFDKERAAKRFSPASTFKIPHTLFALDAGVVQDEFEVFKWDGVERSFAGHNSDQNLRSAIRNSTVWVYQQFAEDIGAEKAKSYLKRIDYGNADPSDDVRNYWLDGQLAISANEQIAFLQRLYRNELPFAVEHQRLIKDLMIVEAERNWILRAKTGWEGRFGWWVGWVEWPEGSVFFALNIDTPNRMADLAKREKITREILTSIDALPSRTAEKNEVDSETTVAVVDTNLYLLGTFDGNTADKVISTLEAHPGVQRIVFTANGGSVNDRDTLRLGRYIRQKGLHTHLISNGVAASGGVSLFLAGVKRSVGQGAHVGVHSWAQCSDSAEASHCKPATDFPRHDTAHDLHRIYTDEMLGADDFYWFSIKSASHNSIHWLSRDELLEFQVVNNELEDTLEIPFADKFRKEYESTCHNCPRASD